jgi:hypothetical protein
LPDCILSGRIDKGELEQSIIFNTNIYGLDLADELKDLVIKIILP